MVIHQKRFVPPIGSFWSFCYKEFGDLVTLPFHLLDDYKYYGTVIWYAMIKQLHNIWRTFHLFLTHMSGLGPATVFCSMTRFYLDICYL